MALFRKSRDSRSFAPSWCAWFGPGEWAAFQELVRERLVPDYARQQALSRSLPGGPASEMDLAHLAETLRDQPRERWSTTVTEYELWWEDRAREAQALAVLPFERARGALLPAVRLVQESDRPDEMTRALGDHLLAEVRLIGERSVLTVDTEQTRQWDVSPADVWSLALANLRRQPCEVHDMGPDGSPVLVVLGSGEHTAAHLLRLDELAGRPALYGVLVVAPRTDALAFWVVTGMNVVTAGPALQKFSASLRDRAEPEQRLSDEVYWWSDGLLEHIVMADLEAGMTRGLGTPDRPHTIQGTPRFLDMLHRMAPPQQ
ncbi:hypothetical protein [Streptomyces laculatispora]|uniref:hypothetical protein n=1 Tax=Streptomyces laculatispora TaxID=887464 RepID=UPI001A941E6D|nr:hypothetical protein [Streptomyces laculatispora]MBO0915480.1 hypothetical protein [Streptomyces laculatispora]